MSSLSRRTVTALATVATVGAVAFSGGSATAAPSAQDTAYIEFAARANLAEVALGELAQKQANSQAVRAFGRDMVKDHSKQYDQLKSVAAALGTTVPSVPNKQQRKIAKLWSGLQGREFTCAYIPFQWDDHQGVIAMTEKEIAEGSDASVKAAAAAALPVLEEHYEHVTMLLGKLKHC